MGMSEEQFEQKWLYTPVRIKGFYDHSKEQTIQRTRDGEKGQEIITPLYTNVTEQGKL